MFDLTIFPLHLIAGREQHELPGLLVSAAPRKAARMRAQDLLLISLTLQVTAASSGSGGPSFSPAQQQEMLRKLAETYFNFSGSVTAGLRAVAARLNDFLLSRNLKAAHEGQTVGILNMAVIHGGALIVAHAGPTHSFVLGKQQVQHFDDSPAAGGGAGRGLGLSRQAIPRFYQVIPDPGDVLLMCANPPAAWSAHAFGTGPQHHFDLLRRRLLSDASSDLQVAAIRFQPGKGQIGYWRPSARSTAEARAQSGIRADGNTPAAEAHPADVAPPAAAIQADADPSLPAAPDPAVAADIASFAPPQMAESLPGAAAHADAAVGLDPDSAGTADRDPSLPDPTVPTLPEDDPGFHYPRPPIEPVEPVQPVETPAAPVARMAGRPGARRVQAEAAVENLPAAAGSTSAARSIAAAGSSAAAADAGQRRPARAARQSAPRAPAGPSPIEVLRQGLGAARLRLHTAWLRGRPARSRVGGFVATSARRVTPKRTNEAGRLVPLFNFTTGTLLAVAIFVPLLVVAVAMTAYLQVGRREQFQVIFQQAQQFAEQAAQHTDPALQRAAWTHAYDLVRRAEQLGPTDESRALFQQSQEALDTLEGYQRIDYRPAVRAFSSEVNITRMIATLNDVYLLDSSAGRILRLYRTASGYEVDPKFSCGPGQAGTLIIGNLIDMAAMPPSNEARATVVGIDSTGNLVYCSPSMSGFVGRTLALPDAFWGEIRAMRVAGDKLFVLDPLNNAVYYYDGINGMFSEKPHLFFDESIPKMSDVIDIAIDQEFLYLLHADGQMTICEGGGISLVSTRCTDTPYGDPRPGYEPSPLAFEGVRFSQIQSTQPPDPSLFALHGETHAIYHLSLRRLNLQRQFRPQVNTDFPLPAQPATAFAIAPNRRALIAFGNQVFFAPVQ